MHTCVLWLGSFADGSSRVRPPHRGVGAKSFRRCLETRPWFCDVLDRAGGADFHKTVLYQCQSQQAAAALSKQQDLKLHGLVQLSTDGCAFENGALTNWSAEDELQRHYLWFASRCLQLACSVYEQMYRACCRASQAESCSGLWWLELR